MTIHNLFIFNKFGTCIFYAEWKLERLSTMPREEEFKLMYGMLHSIRAFVTKLSPNYSRVGFDNFQTSKYKLNYYETPTGLKFIVNSDKTATGIRELLQQIYQAYVECVGRNCFIKPHSIVTSHLFKTRINDIVTKHGAY